MFSKSILALAALVGAVVAQSSSSNITIDPNTVDAQLRASWCNGQQNVCRILCLPGGNSANRCDPSTLSYTCTCNNGTTPNVSVYQTSLPAFECQQAYANCIAAHPNDQLAQDNCNSTIRANCGTQDISTYTATAGSGSAATGASSASSAASTASATSAGAASGTASTTGSATAAATSKSAAVAAIGKEYGAGIFAAGLLGLFGLML